MNRAPLFAIALSVAAALVVAPAFADPTAPTVPAAPAVYVMPVITVPGRPSRPTVVVVVTRPTAAAEAGAAHESLRATLLARSEPVTPHAAN